jgi:prephenate dehydrogenase
MLRRELGDGMEQAVDIDPRQGSDTADITCPGPLQQEQLQQAATVILAVPEPVAVQALATLTPLLRPDALLVETLSVKSRFADSLARLRPSFEVIGINPMFGPSLEMNRRAVAVTPYIAGERAASFTALIAERDAHITDLSPRAHDQAMVALQALPHLLILSYAHALAGFEIDLEDAVRLAPPPASALLALAARIASGNAHVYSEIQTANSFAKPGRESLAEALARISEASTSSVAFEAFLEDVGMDLGESGEVLRAAADRIVGLPLQVDRSAPSELAK